jgi:hypothetical protein
MPQGHHRLPCAHDALTGAPSLMVLMRTTRTLLLVLLNAAPALASAVGCSSPKEPAGPSGDASSDAGVAACAYDLPDACPSPPPSWSNEVQPIIDRTCNACHGDGGVQQHIQDFTTYSGVNRNRGSILSQVYTCKMPPLDAAAPLPQERQALLGWLVCNAPNN